MHTKLESYVLLCMCIFVCVCVCCFYLGAWPTVHWIDDLHVGETTNVVIKFVSDFRQVGGFLQLFRFLPSIKLTYIIEILMKVPLNTTTKRFIQFYKSSITCPYLSWIIAYIYNYCGVLIR
jgi:hypothetical protein